jgi:hypothetical protein
LMVFADRVVSAQCWTVQPPGTLETRVGPSPAVAWVFPTWDVATLVSLDL